MSKLSPALKKETVRLSVMVGAGVVLMIIVFAIAHLIVPEKVPFDYRVILGGLGGGFIAVLNFFLMVLTVQKVTNTEDEDIAKSLMKASYSRRMLLQMAWVVIAVVVPIFQPVAGIVPLLFPSLSIKLLAVTGKINS